MSRWLIIGEPDWAPLSAFAEGLRSVGLDAFWTPINDWAREDCVAAVVYGLRFQGKDIVDHYAARGIPVVVIDHGYIKRVNVVSDLPTGYLQVGINRLGWMPAAAPSADRFEALGVSAQARSPRPIRRALIMGQVAHDASHRLAPAQLEHCYEKLAEELFEVGIKTIAFRPHPLGASVNPKLRYDDVSSLDDAIARADLVVSINSNSGLDAILAGCPAAVLKASHYTELAYRWPVWPALIEAPNPERVNAYLQRLAYAQWTDAEIRAGLPLQFLQSLGAVP